MSDQLDDDDYTDEPETPLIKQLRQQIRKLTKERDDGRAELTKALAGNRSRDVADLFSKKGVDPKYAKWFPADQDATEVNVEAWIEDNKELLPVSQTTPVPPPQAPPADGQTIAPEQLAGLTPDAIQTLQRVQQLGQGPGASTPTLDNAKLTDLAEASKKAGSFEEYVALANQILARN